MGWEEGPSPARAARSGDSPKAAARDCTRDRTTATLAPTPRASAREFEMRAGVTVLIQDAEGVS